MKDSIMNAEGLRAFEKSMQEQIMRWAHVCWYHYGRATFAHAVWYGPGT